MNTYKQSIYNQIIEYKEEYLIYNSLSGALSVMNKEEKKQMDILISEEKDNLTHEEQLFMDHLLLNNYLVPEQANELEVLEKQYNARKQKKDRIVLTILPTMGCNCACSYCFEGGEKRHQAMSREIQDLWLIWLEKNLEGIKHLSVTWFGGEPTMAMSVIRRMSDRMISMCSQHQISYTAGIITNGYNLSEEVVGELYVRRVRMVQVTLDGPSYVHDKIRFLKVNGKGTFNKILKNIRKYSILYPEIHTSIRINVDERNESYCFELLDELKGLPEETRNTNVYFAPIHASTAMCRHISQYTLEAMHYAQVETKLLRKALEYGLTSIGMPPVYMGLCGAANPKGYVALPDGSIHKCWETVSMKKYQVGSILDDTVIQEESFQKWLDWSPFQEQECRECVCLPNCAGMCTYRFRYRENYAGNSALSPCPSLKYELPQRLLIFMEQRHQNLSKGGIKK